MLYDTYIVGYEKDSGLATLQHLIQLLGNYRKTRHNNVAIYERLVYIGVGLIATLSSFSLLGSFASSMVYPWTGLPAFGLSFQC